LTLHKHKKWDKNTKAPTEASHEGREPKLLFKILFVLFYTDEKRPDTRSLFLVIIVGTV
jgi:hypothetical protein